MLLNSSTFVGIDTNRKC